MTGETTFNNASGTLRLMTLIPDHLTDLNDRAFRDILGYLDPDAILLNGSSSKSRRRQLGECPVIPVDSFEERLIGNQWRIVCQETDPKPPGERGQNHVVLMTSQIDRYGSIPETVVDAASERPDETAFLHMNLPAGRTSPPREKSSDIRLVGGKNPEENSDSDPEEETPLPPVPLVVVDPSGHAYTEEVLPVQNLGLRAIKGIGPSRSRTFRNGGYKTRGDLRGADPGALTKLDGIGPHYAAVAHGGSYAHETDTPIWFDDNPLSDRKLAYVDIETNASQVSVIWQIGVYDEATDRYRTFIETFRKGDPRSVPRSFARWVSEEARDRTFLAWYGSGFDFPWLNRFIEQHARNQHVRDWKQVEKLDLLHDVVRPRCSVPARSYKLDVVAGRLGYERAHGGISGRNAAGVYRLWMKGVEPDWDRWVQYCRDDVIGMKHIVDRLREAEKPFDIKDLDR